jgi:hypothetical protein
MGVDPVRPVDGVDAAARLAHTVGDLREALRGLARPGELERPHRILDWHTDGSVDVGPEAWPSENPSSSGEASPVILSVGQLEAFTDPMPSLRATRASLKPGQSIVFIHDDLHEAGAAAGSRTWETLASMRNAFLDTSTSLGVLYQAGFRCLGVQRLKRRISLEEVLIAPAGSPAVVGWRRRVLKLIPRPIRMRVNVVVRSSETAILAVRRDHELPLVSVVIPVFNEAKTAVQVIDSVLRVHLVGAAVEVVIVESNSTDGSREIVQRYANHPRITCLFEDRPRGKGHATRLGLEKARGDILLIQDADLEYDIEDYHSLLNPIIRGHQSFVLGSRHGGRQHWKLRQFSKPFLAAFYNLAHVLVTAYINILFSLNLRDPQTMFKVCRRDCLEGITFHGNYFNFDYELLLKIVRKGYTPVEVPVNYRSRSHAEGKKIRMWRDAPLGLWMITKLRLTPLRRFLHVGEPIE